jgi:hypothetical protein
MKFSEIISERTLADVGVRGGKFYLSARGESMDIEHFLQTGKLVGVQGISSSKYIWREFSPNAGRDLFFVMNANDALKANHLKRIGYDDPDALIANNSKMIGRILSVPDVSKGPSDNLVMGVLQRIPGIKSIQGDLISVGNRALFIAHCLQRGKPMDVEGADPSSFKGNGLQLSSYDDYANLYYQGAKAAGWYGTDFVKFFSPQNRSKWLPGIKAGIISQANVYADESEWANQGGDITVPRSSLIIIAIPKRYMTEEKPVRGRANMTWSNYDDKRWDYYHRLMDAFKTGPYKYKIVDADNTANQLVRSRSKNLPD